MRRKLPFIAPAIATAIGLQACLNVQKGKSYFLMPVEPSAYDENYQLEGRIRHG